MRRISESQLKAQRATFSISSSFFSFSNVLMQLFNKNQHHIKIIRPKQLNVDGYNTEAVS